MSLMRSTMLTHPPSRTVARSPVRNHPPSAKAREVAPGSFQYPLTSDCPRSHSSPTSPSADACPSGPAIRTSTAGAGRPALPGSARYAAPEVASTPPLVSVSP